jgi:hypothetical protein
VNLTPVQNYLAKKGADMLSKRLKTKVEIAHLRIDFLNHILIQGLYIEDQQKDTLLYAGEAQVRITDWFLFKDKPVLHYIGLQNANTHLYRTASSKDWNYQFIVDAFGTPKKSTKKQTINFDLKKALLENVRIHMDDHWVGEDLDFDIGNLVANANDLDFTKEILDVNIIAIKNSAISINEYKGGRPPRALKGPMWEDLAHKTPFNPGNWKVKLGEITLDGCTFRLTSNDKVPEPGLFDENHLFVSNINIVADGINIKGDTLHGNIRNLTAQERCGFAIKTMRSKVTVSPNASICENLYIESNYSKVQNYYAMHYKHFPDFTDYIDSVTMVGHLRDATIDERDIAFFAPQLKNFPHVILKVSGDGKGTVANLAGQHLDITDGINTIKGNATLKGLPDAYKTWITFTNGEILTSGAGILRYVPSLRNSPDIAIEHITHAAFRGQYEGYLENFSVTGTLSSNLGNISTNLKMHIPGFSSKTAVYSGSVSADNVQIGDLLRQPLLGNITFTEDISGSSFNIDEIELKIDGKINQFGINGYPYSNIITHGTITKKQFNGTLLVDDNNLALEFDGGINYANKNIDVRAKAHLLGSNFYAMHLTKDTVTLSADFDLNCSGSNIDNFTGYAKLNNIDLKRNAHKLAVDSILLTSVGDSTNRQLSVKSNDVTATVSGSYQLSKLPASFQYYLSRYIPNYIKPPEKYAPNQNIAFSVTTRNIDSIFAVTYPLIRGFDSSSFTGSLNTSDKKLTFNAKVPHGSVGNFHMNYVAVTGTGDFDALGLNATIENVAVGDSLLTGSLSLTTTVAHDSVGFTVATVSPDTRSSLTLNGDIIAHKDTLSLTLQPSQFFLNQAKWDIAGNSKIVYADKYLLVKGLVLTSGIQRISAMTELQTDGKAIVINTENLDLGQFGAWAGLAMYQPDGRLNGSVRIDKVFEDLYITANIKASDVKISNENIGTINLVGNYDGSKKLLVLDPQTGIFYNDASVSASGNISLDSTTHLPLDGSLEFKNAPVAWATPFLVGIMSQLKGTINGKVGFKGNSYEPELNGKLDLLNGAFRLDYMGCNYTIPFATIDVSNKRIELNKVLLLDDQRNMATVTGHFSHNLFKNMRVNLKATTSKFKVMDLKSYENDLFYGTVIAGIDSLTLKGHFDDLKLRVYNIAPVAKSTVYMPVTSSSGAGSYSYVSFKDYGKNPTDSKIAKKHKDKFHVTINAELNPYAEMVIVLDPTNGDEIRAKGSGSIVMDIPPENDMSITGTYDIDYGTYTYTFNQLFIKRIFTLDEGSRVTFNGGFAQTRMDVNGRYRVKTRLSDLLSDDEKKALSSEATDAQTPQWVLVRLHMYGLLNSPLLTFDLDLEDRHSQSTIAYQKLKLINNDPRQQFAQVGALLLVGTFIPPEGIGTGAAVSGAVNNLSQVITSSASSGLTAIINKLTKDKDLSVAVKYTNYNYSDQLGASNRSEAKIGVSKPFLNDRLIVEAGTTADWGRPTSSSTANASSVNLSGNFLVQYKLSPTGGVRVNAFSTSDYDVALDREIIRNGVGINWRKSFDNLPEFFHGRKYEKKQKEKELEKLKPPVVDTMPHSGTE